MPDSLNIEQIQAEIDLIFGSNVTPESLKKLMVDIVGYIQDIYVQQQIDKDIVGLSNVDNTSDADKPVSTLQLLALNDKANSNTLMDHVDDQGNPHDVTKTQVGLSNVDNTSDADKPVSIAQATALALKIDNSKIGAASGVAPLGSNSLISSVYLPSYVDDVQEYANLAAFPASGESGIIYIALDSYLQYRWSGTTYGKLTIGEVTSVAGRKGVVVLTKSDVGLDQANNTSDANKPISTATQTALNAKQATLVSFVNIAMINGVSILTGGNILLQIPLRAGLDYLTPLAALGIYQPIEDQRLSTWSNPSFSNLAVVNSLSVGGKLIKGVSDPVVIISNYSVLPADDIIICNCPTDFTFVALPASVSANRKIIIKNIGTGFIDVNVTGGGYIDDGTSYRLFQWDSITVLDNSGKYLIL